MRCDFFILVFLINIREINSINFFKKSDTFESHQSVRRDL
jgi:hypothetical protein